MALLIGQLQRDDRKQDERERGDTQQRAPGRDSTWGPLQWRQSLCTCDARSTNWVNGHLEESFFYLCENVQNKLNVYAHRFHRLWKFKEVESGFFFHKKHIRQTLFFQANYMYMSWYMTLGNLSGNITASVTLLTLINCIILFVIVCPCYFVHLRCPPNNQLFLLWSYPGVKLL